mmetsp:Transcript_89244/g.288453  ORF Transcript_89244/g.288453 Transcript_89244/m.288453 type:complete len:233 (+) Transcript_89244:781-1479(+)
MVACCRCQGLIWTRFRSPAQSLSGRRRRAIGRTRWSDIGSRGATPPARAQARRLSSCGCRRSAGLATPISSRSSLAAACHGCPTRAGWCPRAASSTCSSVGASSGPKRGSLPTRTCFFRTHGRGRARASACGAWPGPSASRDSRPSLGRSPSTRPWSAATPRMAVPPWRSSRGRRWRTRGSTPSRTRKSRTLSASTRTPAPRPVPRAATTTTIAVVSSTTTTRRCWGRAERR